MPQCAIKLLKVNWLDEMGEKTCCLGVGSIRRHAISAQSDSTEAMVLGQVPHEIFHPDSDDKLLGCRVELSIGKMPTGRVELEA